MQYITYMSRINGNEILQVGGMGHSFCDYLTPFIISRIYPEIKFIHNKLETTLQKRDMDIDNQNDIFYWNNFLNLDYFNNNIDTSNKQLCDITYYENFKSIDFFNLKNILKNNKNNNIIFYFRNNNRIYLFDLYYYELNGLVRKNITKEIIDELRIAYYQKHKPIKNDKKIINTYIRRGDLFQYLKTNSNIDENYFLFEYLMFKEIYSLCKNHNIINNCIFNVIVAGNQNEVNDVKNLFLEYDNVKNLFLEYDNINFIFNKEQDIVFELMTCSDILIFTNSSFPLTASLYTDGIIIKKRNDHYFMDCVLNKNIVFLSNYLFVDNSLELNNIDNHQKIKKILNIE